MPSNLPPAEASETGAENTRWNLDDLYGSDRELDRDLKQAAAEAEAFAQSYRGRVPALTPAELSGALKEYEGLQERLARAHTYAYLVWSTDTNEPRNGALLQKVREEANRIVQGVLFFELEWLQVDDETARRLTEAAELVGFRHYLERERLMRDHVLSEPEEKILAEKGITGQAAWSRFFDETLGAVTFDFRGQRLTEQEILSRIYDPDREVRRDAAASLSEGLRSNLRTTAYVFNVILADKASEDRLRRFPHWLAARNVSNEISDEAVASLVEAVTGRYDLVARFYRLKKEILGLDELYDYDRYAPLAAAQERYTWEQARNLVLDAFSAFHPRMGAIAREFFEKGWIDAAVAPGKRSGAYSHSAVPSVHPYVFLNYTATARDVQTLAHELGHGVHQYLARKQGYLQSRPPLTTSETASVFGEMLVFTRLMEREKDPMSKLGLLAGKIDDTLATVFRQATMHRFEDRIHNARRQEGELPPSRFNELWMETQRAMFRDSVVLGDQYALWWSYIPHFVHTPGYVYAYAFGELLVLALYARYLEEGDPFAERYLELLESGGSDWPHVLVGRLGVDLNDTGFWNQGLGAIENLIAEAEELAG